MPQVRAAGRKGGALVARLDGMLGRLIAPVVDLVPRRLRRAAEKIERRQRSPIGQRAAAGFLLATIVYALIIGGQIGRVGDALLVAVGFGVENIQISGHAETSEIDILEKLDVGGSLVSFDAGEARNRVATLPWVARATVRKLYPNTIAVEIEERKPFALWQRSGEIVLIDSGGTEIVPLEERRHAGLPFMVGEGANLAGADMLAEVLSEPEIARQMRAAVFVAERRWDLHLDRGVTVKLPEKNIPGALKQLVKLNAERRLLARDVIVVDLRLPDRITVRLPEGRSLEEIAPEAADSALNVARART